MKLLALALLLACAPAVARADMGGIANPTATDVPPAPEPVELNKGDPAPFRGALVGDARADWIASRCAADKAARQDLEKAIQEPPGGYTGTALAVSAGVGVVVGVVLTVLLVKAIK